jgi:hypothetical protein
VKVGLSHEGNNTDECISEQGPEEILGSEGREITGGWKK